MDVMNQAKVVSNLRSAYYKTLSNEAKDRYDYKISQFQNIDPFVIPKKDLSLKKQDFPFISLEDIKNYLIHSISAYTKRDFRAYKSTDAYQYLQSGFVLSVHAYKLKNPSAIVVGKVGHSQRMNDTPLSVWVHVLLTGEIKSAHCTCMAGLSETCSHIGAILFAVENLFDSANELSVTDVLAKWNVPKFKDVSMEESHKIQWNLPPKSIPTTETQKKSVTSVHFTSEEVERLIRSIIDDGEVTSVQTVLPPFSKEEFNLQIDSKAFLCNLYDENYRSKSHAELLQIGKSISLQITDLEAEKISEKTYKQHNQKLWFSLRAGRITASRFKDVCVGKIEKPAITTINKICQMSRQLKVPAIKYGITNEKRALNEYVDKMTASHDNFRYTNNGLIIDPNYPYLGASPDGKVYCDCHGYGTVELKCPYRLFMNGPCDDPFEILTKPPNNILIKTKDGYDMNKKHAYYYQVQMQIFLSKVNYSNFVIWSIFGMLNLTIKPDTDFWNENRMKAELFFFNVLMPELLSKYYSNKYGEDLSNSFELLQNDGEEELVDDQSSEDVLVDYDDDVDLQNLSLFN